MCHNKHVEKAQHDKHLKPGHYDFTGLGSAEARSQAAQVDADIEGLARDPQSAARFKEWEEQGLSIDEQIQRLKEFYTRPEYEAADDALHDAKIAALKSEAGSKSE